MSTHRLTEAHSESVFGLNGKLNGIIKSYKKGLDDVNFRKKIEESAYLQAIQDRKAVTAEMEEIYKLRE